MMKKIIGIILAAALIFVAPVTAQAAIVGSTTNFDQVAAGYSIIPDNIKALIEARGIVINTQDGLILGPSYLGYNALECYQDSGVIASHQIYVDVYSNKRAIVHTLVHEIGHVVDFGGNYYTRWSAQPLWNQIWLLEAPTADLNCAGTYSDPLYEKSSSMEYFAGAFVAYLIDPVGLATTAPQTYGYIEAVIASY